jgi:hypothetical protein
MTPQEALAQALDATFFPPSGPYLKDYPPSTERAAYRMAGTILAALPEGWRLTDALEVDELRKLCREIQDRSFDGPIYVRPGVASQVDIRAALSKMIPDYEEMARRSIEATLARYREEEG